VQFGPEVEVTLNDLDDGPGSELLDLDFGKVLDVDRNFDRWPEEQQWQWIEASGADVMVDYVGQWGLISPSGNAVKLVLVENSVWAGLGKAQLDRELTRPHPGVQTLSAKPGTVYSLGTNPAPPLTFAFATAKGTRGLLQVTELAQKPNRVKLRFKIASGTASATAATFSRRRTKGQAMPYRGHLPPGRDLK
jgi:hypothetical protein